MSAYRFCRSDDVPLLVAAYNACYRVHFPGSPAMTVEGFKQAIREIDLWTSSCMVAFAGDEPVGVLLSAKRATQSLIWRVGVRPGHQRAGHGKHLMTSLSQKLAILGPRRLCAELPAAWTGPRSFLRACGYEKERTWMDFERPAEPTVGDSPLVGPVGVDELLEQGLLTRPARSCWEGAAATLIQRKEDLAGLAVAGAERLEAWVLYHDAASGGTREIRAFGCVDPARRAPLLGLLLRYPSGGRVVRLSRVDRDEIDFALLEGWGFREAGGTIRYATEAREG